MRVLITSVGAAGHIFPLVSIAHALRAAGHEILWATPAAELVSQTGLPAFDSAPDADIMEIYGKVMTELGYVLQFGRDEYAKTIPMTAQMMAGFAEPVVDRTVEVAQDWRPDLVLHDELDAVGPLVAGKLGVPAVDQVLSVCAYRDIREQTRQHLDDAYDRHGVTGQPEKSAVLDTRPPSMRRHDFGGWSMRCLPYNSSGVLPRWLVQEPARPRVAITFGTTIPAFTGLDAFRPMIEAAGQVDAEFVLASGDADLSVFGELPGNVRGAGWVPLNALLRTCTAMIHHVGGGTALHGLDAGVTHLTLPGTADSWQVSEVITERGLGVEATPAEVDADLIRTVLFDPSMRAAAAEVKAEIGAMPTPADLVPRLVALAG